MPIYEHHSTHIINGSSSAFRDLIKNESCNDIFTEAAMQPVPRLVINKAFSTYLQKLPIR